MLYSRRSFPCVIDNNDAIFSFLCNDGLKVLLWEEHSLKSSVSVSEVLALNHLAHTEISSDETVASEVAVCLINNCMCADVMVCFCCAGVVLESSTLKCTHCLHFGHFIIRTLTVHVGGNSVFSGRCFPCNSAITKPSSRHTKITPKLTCGGYKATLDFSGSAS